MLQILFTFVLITLFWTAVLGAIVSTMIELSYSIALVNNPNRKYHILAFLGLLFAVVYSIIQYFDKVLELAKMMK